MLIPFKNREVKCNVFDCHLKISLLGMKLFLERYSEVFSALLNFTHVTKLKLL